MKTLYVLDENANLHLDERSLRVTQPRRADIRIPLSRVARAVIRLPDDNLMQVCVSIVASGGIVHIQNARGELCAVIQQPMPDGTAWARELATRIAHHPGEWLYQDWRSMQQRHAWSLVFHSNFTGDFESNRKRLVKYMKYFAPEIEIESEIRWLNQQCIGWIQGQFELQGLQPVVRAIQQKGKQLLAELLPCLLIPLLWEYVKWRRAHKNAIVHDRLTFFELQCAGRLQQQFDRHIGALSSIYSSAWMSSANDYHIQPHRVLWP